MSSSNPDLRYVQYTAAGAQYVEQISAQESDRNTRAAFRDRALSIAPSGAALNVTCDMISSSVRIGMINNADVLYQFLRRLGKEQQRTEAD